MLDRGTAVRLVISIPPSAAYPPAGSVGHVVSLLGTEACMVQFWAQGLMRPVAWSWVEAVESEVFVVGGEDTPHD